MDGCQALGLDALELVVLEAGHDAFEGEVASRSRCLPQDQVGDGVLVALPLDSGE
jgi:hypothetical protein